MAKTDRPGKGQSLLCLPRDYTVVDTETTGLSSEACSLIEVSALRVRGGQVQEEFSTLIRPPWREVEKQGEWTMGYVDDFIQGLTGITDEMLEGAPQPEDALPQVGAKLDREVTGKTDYLVVPAAGDQPLPGKGDGPVILPEAAFLRLLGEEALEGKR